MKINFIPLIAKRATKEEFYLTISSNALIRFPKGLMINFGIDISKPIFIKLFIDSVKKILGFQFKREEELSKFNDKSVRMMSPIQPTRGSLFYQTSIRSFLNSLPVQPQLPIKHLKIEKYNDSILGEIFYIKI